MASPVAILGSIASLQVEANYDTHNVVIQGRGGSKLSPAGLCAVITALNTYFNTTLTAAQRAAIPDFACSVAAGTVIVYAAPGTEAQLGAALISAIGANTVKG
jgi:hypothetical protein